jgi:tetratricopeptide (TPR) repeat protein/class 3 adenylate cyclase
MKCDKCGYENSGQAKFCSKCGTRMAGVEAGEERRFATILCADLEDYTALSESRDPEEVREIIRSLFSRFETILDRFQAGHHEYTGDATIALFGVPISYPRDAERAINAGLAMQKEIALYAKKIKVPLKMRIGINSGEVVYSAIPGKMTVTGNAVGIAHKVESIARTGKVLISSTTAKLAAGRFSMTSLPGLTPRGKEGEIGTFEITGLKKTYPGFTSPMIGREKEMARLKTIFESDKKPSFTVISGNMGIGKSRLIFEFRKRLDQITSDSPTPIKIADVRCWSRTTSPYQALADLIRALLDIKEPLLTTESICKIKAGTLSRDPLTKHFLGFFFGVKWKPSPLDYLQPEAARLSAFVTLKNLIEHVAAGQQLVMILEDFHLADSATTDFVRYLTQIEFQGNSTLLIAGRNEGFVKEARKDGKWNSIELSTLSRTEANKLVRNCWKGKEIPEETVERVLERTGRNPLFLQEFAKDLGERELVPGEAEVSLPDSLWALLEARIDRLPARERRVLRASSVIGEVFWTRILESLVKEDVETELSVLEQKDYVYECIPSKIVSNREYTFRHDPLREAAYKTILMKERREFHGRVLTHLEASFKRKEMQSDLFFGLAAHHSELGQEYEKAVDFYSKAGENSIERYAPEQAVEAYTNAIRILTQKLESQDDKRIPALIRKRGEAEVFLCKYEDATKDYEKLTQFEDEETKISGLRGLATVCGRKGDFDKALDYLVRAKDILEKHGVVELEAQILVSIANIYTGKAAYDKSLEFSKSAYKIYKKIASSKGKDEQGKIKDWIAGILTSMGSPHLMLGHYDKALDLYTQSLEMKRETGDKSGIARNLNNIGVAYQELADYDKSLSFHTKSLKIKREIGDRYLIAGSLHNIGDIHRCKGNYKKALSFHNESLKMSREVGQKPGIAMSLSNIGGIYGEFGDYKKAIDCEEEAERISREIGAKAWLVECLNEKGEIYSQTGEFSKAVKSLEEALSICEKLRMRTVVCDTLSLLSRAAIGASLQKKSIKKAEDYLTKGEKIAKESGSEEAEQSMLLGRTRFHLSTGEHEKSLEASKKLLDLLKRVKRRDALFVETLYLVGKSLHEMGKKKESDKYLSRSLTLAQKMGLKPLVSEIQAVSGPE